jgi:hypothetical protein
MHKTTPSAMESGLIRGMASIEWNKLVVLISQAFEICPDNRGVLWWKWSYKRGDYCIMLITSTYFFLKKIKR